MKIVVTLTSDDYLQFSAFTCCELYSDQNRNDQLKAGLVVVVMLLGGALAALNYSIHGGYINIDATSLLIGSLPCAAIIAYFLINATRTKDSLMPIDGGSVIGTHEYEITEKSITDSIGHHVSTTSWAGVYRLEETDVCYYIYIDKAFAHIVPKRSFESAENRSEFDTLVSQYVEASTRKMHS